MDTRSFQSTGHAIARCKAKACNAVRRFAFTVETTQRAYLGRPVETQTVSVDGGNPINVRDRHGFESVLYRHAGTCPTCSGPATVRPVRGVLVADKTCDGRCMGAFGPSCECSCAGQNHGAKFD